MLTIEEIEQFSPEKMRRISISRWYRKRHGNREKLTREKLIDFLRQKNITSWGKLLAQRSRTDPTPRDYVKEFGSWSNATKEAHGFCRVKPTCSQFAQSVVPDVSKRYLAKVIVEFDLWTQVRYRAAAKKHPDVIPSLSRVQKIMGSWRNTLECAARLSRIEMLRRYTALYQKLGRPPIGRECRERDIDLSVLVGFFNGKVHLNDFVLRLTSIPKGKYENRDRSAPVVSQAPSQSSVRPQTAVP